MSLIDDVIDQCVLDAQTSQVLHEPVFYDAHETELAITEGIPPAPTPSGPKVISKREPDYHQPFFGWSATDLIKKTFEHTTQYARLPAGTLRKKAFKSPSSALNVFRCQEDVACDIIYSDVAAICDGSTVAVIFVGVNTQVTDVYGIKTDKQFVNTMEDNIIQRGAALKSVTVVNPLSVTRLQISCVHSVLTTGKVNTINSTRIRLKDTTRPSRIVLTVFLTALEPLPIGGC
jgi:hypothetical protein